MVSVLPTAGGTSQLTDFSTKDAGMLIDMYAGQMSQAMSQHLPMVNDLNLIMSPEHHALLVKGGYTTKRQVQEALFRACNIRFAPHIANVVGNTLRSYFGVHWILATVLSTLIGFFCRAAAVLGMPVGGSLSKFSSPESFHIVLAGADAGKFSAWCHGFGLGEKHSIKPMQATAHMANPVHRLVGSAPNSASLPRTLAEASWPVKPSATEERPDSRPADSPNPRQSLSPWTLNLTRHPTWRLVEDPTGDRDTEKFQLAARHECFRAGDTVGLLDISKYNGVNFLNRVEARLREEYPLIDVKRYAKPTFSRPCPEALRQEILKDCAVVVSALAD